MFGQIFISGLLLGLLSSFHCVGMCGPIAFALPVNLLPGHKKLLGLLLYNAGRIAVYAVFGLLFGFVGRQVYLGGFQQWFSIALGCIVLFFVIQSVLNKEFLHIRLFQGFNVKLQQFISRFIHKKQLVAMFTLGAANGLLPCGMVYLAVTGAMAAGTVAGGVEFMSAYGLGTFPAMFALSYFGFFINLSVRNRIKKLLPFFMAAMGVLLILRGMNLGIPYISPYFDNSLTKMATCH